MLDYHILDVFTDRAFAGNPLAVVLGADGLGTAQMLRLAREFNLSETIFVQAPQNPAHRARVRIFFPTAEIPFAGHPTIGCAILLAALDGMAEGELVLEEEAGLVPVRVSGGQAEFRAPVLPHALPVMPDAAVCAAALGVRDDDIGFGAHRPGVFAGGPAFGYVPLRDLDALARATPHQPHWSALMRLAGVDSAFLYTPVEGGFRARMFSPTAGIPEDPATGSASAILAAALWRAGDLGLGETRLTIWQGVEMGRPSTIGLRFMCDAQGVQAVHVAGQAVRIAQGRILVPEGE
jgi:trans-2,3-dihydro-3-hydroxyanthranilate isomerase